MSSKGNDRKTDERKQKNTIIKNLVTVVAFIILLFIISTLFITLSIYWVNNAYHARILTDLVDNLKSGDQNDLLTLEKVYELRTGLVNSDILSLLFPIFSAIFLTIGLFILGQVSTAQNDITKQTSEISLNINKNEQQLDDLQKTHDKLIPIIDKAQQVISIINFESGLTSIHNYTNLLWININSNGTYDDIENIIVSMRDSIIELERLIVKLKDGIGYIDPEHLYSLNRQMNLCLIRIQPLKNANLPIPFKTAIEGFIEKLNILYNEYKQLKS